MKKYVWLGFSFLWSWQAVAQQEISLPERQAIVLQRCLLDRGMLNKVCGGDEHPNLFEHPRFAPALQKFLNPAQYQLLIDNGNFIFQKPEYDRNRLDIAIGFCPPASNNQHENIQPLSCPDILVISFSWEKPLNEIAKSYSAELDHALQTPDLPKNQRPLSPPLNMSKAILGAGGQGGKLQILLLQVFEVANDDQVVSAVSYWQDGMREKVILVPNGNQPSPDCDGRCMPDIDWGAQMYQPVEKICQNIIRDGPVACMQALEKVFANVR